LRLAERLYQSIQLIHPQSKKPSSMNGWALEIDRIMQIDGRSVDAIEEIIDYLPHDAFWCNNVLSGNKLRKQFARLEQAKLESEARKSGTPRGLAPRVDWAKQICRPILETNKNAFFSFDDTFLCIGDERKDEASYTKIFYSSHGFEEQVNNALRKWGLK